MKYLRRLFSKLILGRYFKFVFAGIYEKQIFAVNLTYETKKRLREDLLSKMGYSIDEAREQYDIWFPDQIDY